MKRRGFLGLLSVVPFLGFLPVATLTSWAYEQFDEADRLLRFHREAVEHRRKLVQDILASIKKIDVEKAIPAPRTTDS